MSHAGGTELLRSLLEPLAPAFALVTTLGSGEFYVVALTIVYWLGDYTPLVGAPDREQVIRVVAIALGALALTALLKTVTALPRPPTAAMPVSTAGLPDPIASLVASVSVEDGYSLPSGHALGATAVYGSLGWLYARHGDRRPLYAGAVLALLVGISRIAIGVHYLADVVAGFLVGAALVAVVFRVAPTPLRALSLATALAVVALLVVGPIDTLSFAVAWTVTATGTWWLLADRTPPAPGSRREAALTLGLGLLLVGGPFVAVTVVDPGLVVTTVANAAILVGILAMPRLAGALADAVFSR